MKWNEQEINKMSGNGITPLLLTLLHIRGIDTPEAINGFLDPSLMDLHDPYLLDGMDRAVRRVLKAINECENICIYGDYDVDGITSAALLYDCFDGLGADVTFYIPDRFNSGYGLSTDALEKIIDQGTSLIVSVDCGTTAFEEVEYINSMNCDIIITDHHACKDVLPDAYEILNPVKPDSKYPYADLSGIGVAYKFITALYNKLNMQGREHGYLDLVAVGTIADAVRMDGENRIIVYHGLKKLNKKPNLGLLQLIDQSNMTGKPIDEDVIGYVIAPRINAAGRLDDPAKAVKLLLTDNNQIAQEIAGILCDLNRERQKIQAQILEAVEEKIGSDPMFLKEDVLVVSGNDWHSGIIGIVASITMQKHQKPTLIITVDDNGIGKGSARSLSYFNMFEALKDSSELLLAYGGHEKAAGFSIEEKNIDEFRETINKYFQQIDRKQDDNIQEYDMLLNNEKIDIEAVESIFRMAPFGEGNEKPVFAYKGMKISNISFCGVDEKHIKIVINSQTEKFDCIGFNMANNYRELVYGTKVDVIGYLKINNWRNMKSIQIQLLDLIEV